jgi:hypothetical protein
MSSTRVLPMGLPLAGALSAGGDWGLTVLAVLAFLVLLLTARTVALRHHRTPGPAVLRHRGR